MKNNKIEKVISSSISQYFANNLQQIGFSSNTKAVLTSVKEMTDNALDACQEFGVLPDVYIELERLGSGLIKGSDKIKLTVRDNGPGIPKESIAKVYGEYLASSKAGKSRPTRGVQGIGGVAVTAWAQATNAQGAKVTTKQEGAKKAEQCYVEVDIKTNTGTIREPKQVEVDFIHGTQVEFIFDGKIQLNGEAGILTYLNGTALVNPSLRLTYKMPDEAPVIIDRVSEEIRIIPPATSPHPHTMKLGDFISHAGIFHNIKVRYWLQDSFSKITDSAINELVKNGLDKKLLIKNIDDLTEPEKKELYSKIQDIKLAPPSTKSVSSIGEENLEKSIKRLGNVDFFSVITREATICDFRPVQVEIALARLSDIKDQDSPVQVLRFANLVPLQFDKKACVCTQAIESVNWKAYGLSQPKDSVPVGPFVFAISITSPFIKFKNASKETIDASDELLQEIRLALIQAGQKLAKFVKKEEKEEDLERKRQYIEMFAPVLIKYLQKVTDCSNKDKTDAEAGLKKILGRDINEVSLDLDKVNKKIEKESKE